jgi:hypothetical protein
LGEIDAAIAARAAEIKTPEEHAKLFALFRAEILGVERADAAARCKKWTAELVAVGGAQDELVAHCRWVVKNVRQKAALILLAEPRAAAVVAEVRARAQEVLRNPSAHETSRH